MQERFNLRARQINDILDEDRRINKQVLGRSFEQVKAFSQNVLPLSQNDEMLKLTLMTAVDKMQDHLETEISVLNTILQNENGDIEDTFYPFVFIQYWNIIINEFLKKNINSSTRLNYKSIISVLEPYLDSIIYGYKFIIEDLSSTGNNKVVSRENRTIIQKNIKNIFFSYVVLRFIRELIYNSDYKNININDINLKAKNYILDFSEPVRNAIEKNKTALNYFSESSLDKNKLLMEKYIKTHEKYLERKLTLGERAEIQNRINSNRDAIDDFDFNNKSIALPPDISPSNFSNNIPPDNTIIDLKNDSDNNSDNEDSNEKKKFRGFLAKNSDYVIPKNIKKRYISREKANRDYEKVKDIYEKNIAFKKMMEIEDMKDNYEDVLLKLIIENQKKFMKYEIDNDEFQEKNMKYNEKIRTLGYDDLNDFLNEYGKSADQFLKKKEKKSFKEKKNTSDKVNQNTIDKAKKIINRTYKRDEGNEKIIKTLKEKRYFELLQLFEQNNRLKDNGTNDPDIYENNKNIILKEIQKMGFSGFKEFLDYMSENKKDYYEEEEEEGDNKKNIKGKGKINKVQKINMDERYKKAFENDKNDCMIGNGINNRLHDDEEIYNNHMKALEKKNYMKKLYKM